MWTNHKLKIRKMPTGDNERLTEAVQQLSDEVAELHERVELQRQAKLRKIFLTAIAERTRSS